MVDNKIAEELITYKLTGKETLNSLDKTFRKIMKKHNISQNSPVYNDRGEQTGVVGDRFEWTLYKTLWLSVIESWLTLRDIFGVGEEE